MKSKEMIFRNNPRLQIYDETNYSPVERIVRFAPPDFDNDFQIELFELVVFLDRLMKILYEDKLKVCPACGSDFEYRRVGTRRSYQCIICYNQIYPTANTPFHKTRTAYSYWYELLREYMRVKDFENCPVNLMDYKRKWGLTYKTVWRMRQQTKIFVEQAEQTDIKKLIEDVYYIYE